MLPDYYEFQHSTKMISGKSALENIPAELVMLGSRRPMILSDRILHEIGTLSVVCDALCAEGISIGAVFHDIPADSSSAVVNQIAERYRECGCDGLVAVGGGSVLDTAKGVRMLLSQRVEDIMELLGCEIMGRGRHIPFVAVPTTSGTGSESTLVAVIKNAADGMKMEFISYYLQPDVTVLDVRMTETLPARMTASTGLDTLCHAIEACTCLQKNPLSDAYGTAAIRMVGKYLERAVRNGKDKEARLGMANAAAMAGAAFSNSMVGVVHAAGHALGSVCHVPHADAMTILLPYCMEYNMDKLSGAYGELLLYLCGPEAYAGTAAEERGEAMVQGVRVLERRLHKLCGLPMTLREAGVERKDLEAVAVAALNDGAMIVNPKKADKEDVLRILENAYA
ncbi:iron-containing alcohol dehydrogenase [Lacrimispora sp. NSJ-141]|uniref:Iron-containing alcohol dehydrogenase n=1 Tax=Lientehia hominis TaxID=2897778 RepID=A0AAP2RI44_9FIRM|nr:iron-containing alcohol dehydrogenase [Lientehia hominis]MCD2492442.1 iron-containing alcohol dehydrogenase [Lientehia hominis]